MTDHQPQQDRPLWEVMRHAYDQSSVPSTLIDASDPSTGDCLTDRYGYAAEIRALADEVVPEQPEPSPYVDSIMGWVMDQNPHVEWKTRQAIRQRLLAEADHAEKGE
jgi:hypothetical protein